MKDFLHEPYRLPLIPGAKPAIEAGIAAGALTGWLSGSGSSVLCVAKPREAAKVIREVGQEHGLIVVYPDGWDNSWNAGACCGTSARGNSSRTSPASGSRRAMSRA